MRALHARRRRLCCWLAAILGLGIMVAAMPGRAAAPRYRPRPGSSRPIIALTSSAARLRAVEASMARFILSLQANDRVAASRVLSRRVGPARRREFLRARWLTRDSTRDFALVYFLPAIRIQARGVSGARAVVRVEPLTPHAPRDMPIGFIDVPVYREGGAWRINPVSATAPRPARKPARRS